MITEERFDDPLATIQGKFDVIVIQEVFEHLHKPLHIAQYLIDHLKRGGIFFFDYIKSDATGLDTLAGLEEREMTLDFLYKALEPLAKSWPNPKKSVGLIVGKKR